MSDLISRQVAIDAVNKICDRCGKYKKYDGVMCGTCYLDGVADIIEDLPSAQPEQKTGRWLIRKFGADAQCSVCGKYFSDVYDLENSDAYCRHCGSKMEGLKVMKNE